MCNYRHPGPRCVRKWGSEQHLLPPFPRENRENRDRLVNSGRLDFMRRRATSEHLAPPEAALAPRGGSVELWVGPGRPCGALGGPGGASGRVWRSSLQTLWEALGEPLGAFVKPWGTVLWEALYIAKLPINRTCGRYVTISDHCFRIIIGHSIAIALYLCRLA